MLTLVILAALACCAIAEAEVVTNGVPVSTNAPATNITDYVFSAEIHSPKVHEAKVHSLGEREDAPPPPAPKPDEPEMSMPEGEEKPVSP